MLSARLSIDGNVGGSCGGGGIVVASLALFAAVVVCIFSVLPDERDRSVSECPESKPADWNSQHGRTMWPDGASSS